MIARSLSLPFFVIIFVAQIKRYPVQQKPRELETLSAEIDHSVDSPLDFYPLPRGTRGERFPTNDPLKKSVLEPRPESRKEYLHGLLQAIARSVCVPGVGGEASTRVYIRMAYRKSNKYFLESQRLLGHYSINPLSPASSTETMMYHLSHGRNAFFSVLEKGGERWIRDVGSARSDEACEGRHGGRGCSESRLDSHEAAPAQRSRRLVPPC